ncbi:mismatch-specific DNA-glycosylase [Corynebacterium aquatimens]|uniref:mismatch-specific DNA-glycosylase n=1 Tax=Corynebacterium TaxID=1716 RepID=UPI001F22E669|nr:MULTISPECIES: mismatch-specific DNA-glycosylase [Corynebacterium]QYH19853.1 mismatch-specific DNA-glycosylase [Corynebacterium aquatimens]UIZ92996.1 mismatch-specific DNA-glycosylase [Corynebacterium sp. CNCTC7651]
MHDRNLADAAVWIVGINPGARSEAVDAPFAHPGNRFWPALHQAGITPYLVNAAEGLSPEDEAMLAAAGIGFTNIVDRFTPRASELSNDELRAGGEALLGKVRHFQPAGLMVAGIGAYRTAFRRPRAARGPQEPIGSTRVWVVGNPSGLNAHETVASLAQSYREAYDALTQNAV